MGDHAKWAEKFGATRLIHKSEVNAQQGTVDCEMQLEGEGPWELGDGSTDIQFILVPGHSTGSICMFFPSRKILFTGINHPSVCSPIICLALYPLIVFAGLAFECFFRLSLAGSA